MKNIVSADDETLPTILIVEDDVVTSKLVAHHLQKFGKVIITKNAREAIANHNVLSPDIILLDIHYHDDIYNGFDVLANILGVNKDAFVIMFSSDHDPEISNKALAMGAQGFIAKPFHADDFTDYMRNYTTKKMGLH